MRLAGARLIFYRATRARSKVGGIRFRVPSHPSEGRGRVAYFHRQHGVGEFRFPETDGTSLERGPPAKRAFKHARLRRSVPFRQCARTSVSAPAHLHTLREVRSRFAVSEISQRHERRECIRSRSTRSSGVVLHVLTHLRIRFSAARFRTLRRAIPLRTIRLPNASARGSGNASPGTLPFARALKSLASPPRMSFAQAFRVQRAVHNADAVKTSREHRTLRALRLS